jgi:Uma2 family endonuclease
MSTRTQHATIEEFDQLVAPWEAERLRQRVDLIRGEIRFTSPARPEHEDILTYLEDWSAEWAGKYGFRKRSEKSVEFAGLVSVPEPDLVWVKRRRYRKARPTSADVGLVLEISYSSLSEDRGEMAELYADARIAEYWIVNCVDSVIEVHRDPVNGVYRQRFVVEPGQTIAPLIAPDAELNVADLFAEE